MAGFPFFNKSREAYILSKEEIGRLLFVCDPMLGSMVRFGLCSGLTQEEIAGVRIADLDMVGQAVVVRTPKSTRTVYMPLAGLEGVRKYTNNGHGPSDYLFSYGRIQLSRKLEEASKKALGRRLTWLDIIHTYVNLCAKGGVPLQLTAVNLGITADRLMDQYGMTPEEGRKVLNSGFNGVF